MPRGPPHRGQIHRSVTVIRWRARCCRRSARFVVRPFLLFGWVFRRLGAGWWWARCPPGWLVGVRRSSAGREPVAPHGIPEQPGPPGLSIQAVGFALAIGEDALSARRTWSRLLLGGDDHTWGCRSAVESWMARQTPLAASLGRRRSVEASALGYPRGEAAAPSTRCGTPSWDRGTVIRYECA